MCLCMTTQMGKKKSEYFIGVFKKKCFPPICRAQFHRAAKQLIFDFIALLTVKHRERHANLLAVIASK